MRLHPPWSVSGVSLYKHFSILVKLLHNVSMCNICSRRDIVSWLRLTFTCTLSFLIFILFWVNIKKNRLRTFNRHDWLILITELIHWVGSENLRIHLLERTSLHTPRQYKHVEASEWLRDPISPWIGQFKLFRFWPYKFIRHDFIYVLQCNTIAYIG